MSKKILVIGSINIDKVFHLSNFPMIGETIESNKTTKFYGGKGANQAVASYKMSEGNIVSLFAKIGSNKDDDNIIDELKKYKINTKYVSRSIKETGSAMILISEKEQDNQIILDKGANGDFSNEDFEKLDKAIQEHDYILLQLETNKWLIDNSLSLAQKYNKLVVMNPSPAENFDWKWLNKIDWIIPNETELEKISNQNITNLEDIKNSIDWLRKKKLKKIIVTLGGNGAYYDSIVEKKFLKTERVTPIDTTGAGDTFIGTFVGNLDKINDENNILLSMKASKETILNYGVHNAIPEYKDLIKYRKR